MNRAEATSYFLTSLVPIYRARLQQIRNRVRRLNEPLVREVVDIAAQYAGELRLSISAKYTSECRQMWHDYLGDVYKADHRNFDSYKEIANIIQSAFSFSADHDLHPYGSGGTMLGLIEDVLFEAKEEPLADYTVLTGKWWEGLAAKRRLRILRDAAHAFREKKQIKERQQKGSNTNG